MHLDLHNARLLSRGLLLQVALLSLASNKLTGTVPVEIGLLVEAGMTELDLLSLNLTGVIPESICYLRSSNCSEANPGWGYSLAFDCSETLCGCDCNCSVV